MAALDRVVQDITGDQAAVADPHTHMPGGVQTIFGVCTAVDIGSAEQVPREGSAA